MHHSLPHSAHIHCLVSINIQQVSMNVSGCHFFCMEKISCTPLLYPHFHVRHCFVGLPLCCHLRHSNKMPKGYQREGSTSTAIPPASASDVVGHQNKTGGVTFSAALVCVLFTGIGSPGRWLSHRPWMCLRAVWMLIYIILFFLPSLCWLFHRFLSFPQLRISVCLWWHVFDICVCSWLTQNPMKFSLWVGFLVSGAIFKIITLYFRWYFHFMQVAMWMLELSLLIPSLVAVVDKILEQIRSLNIAGSL